MINCAFKLYCLPIHSCSGDFFIIIRFDTCYRQAFCFTSNFPKHFYLAVMYVYIIIWYFYVQVRITFISVYMCILSELFCALSQGRRFNTNLYCYYLSTRFRPFLVDNEPTSPALPAQCKTLTEMCKKRVIYNNYHTTTTTKARVLAKGPRRKKTKKGKEEEPTTRESEARN